MQPTKEFHAISNFNHIFVPTAESTAPGNKIGTFMKEGLLG
jgi:hypothetical protein